MVALGSYVLRQGLHLQPLTSLPLFPLKDFLGQAFLALGEVIGGQGSRVERPLT